MLNSLQILTASYIGYFGRSPEAAGYDLWKGRILNGESLNSVANDFSHSTEAQELYPALISNDKEGIAKFLTDVYQNLFERDAEPAGIDFWSGEIASGKTTVGNVILSIIQNANGSDVTALLNKIEVADAYTNASELAGHFDIKDAREVIADVGESTASVKHGLELVKEATYPTHEPSPPSGGGGGSGGGTVIVHVPEEHKLTYTNDTHVDVTSTKGFGGTEMNFGSGNSADHKLVMLDETSGVELALGVNFRTGNQVIGVSEGDGIARFNGISGHQIDGFENMQGTRLDRAAMSFDFSVNKGVGDLMDGHQKFFLMLDTDPGVGKESFLEIELRPVASGVTVGFLGGTPVISDDDGNNPHISQNSVNPGFAFWSNHIEGVGEGGSGDIPEGEYVVRLEERASDGVTVIGSVTAILDLHSMAA